ncbi:MAG: type 11 methyltransferase [Acidimicrobiaceae bacterium]|nr:MAG: type 11 methyltransferase [Acidimicrobiaceae bacterium]
MRDEDFEQLHHLEDTYWWFVGMRDVQAALFDPVVESARPFLRPAGERVVVDLGCGTGGNLTWLRRYGADATVGGLDVVEHALRFCRTRGEHKVVLASATDLPYPDESCDIACSFDVLVQIPGDGGDERALAEMYRVLRPGGVAFVRGAAYEWMRSGHDEALHTQRRYSLHQLSERSRRAGFEVVRATYANTVLFPVAAVRRLVLMRVGVASADSDVKPMPRGLRWINRPFTWMLQFEALLLKRRWARLPFGLSVIVVLRKPPTADQQ